MFERAIFVSAEDDTYVVHGGIGTYLGVLTKSIRKLFPDTEVIWITKSHKEEDFVEVDRYGVQKYYLAEFEPSAAALPFIRRYAPLIGDRVAKYSSFLHRVEELCSQFIHASDRKTLIEAGEWEGHAQGLFRALNAPHLFKVVRLHTPLAVCMGQNSLSHSSSNYLQMLNEYQQVKHAHFISSCTDYMKEKVIHEMLGFDHPLSSRIASLPNPIDVEGYMKHRYTKAESLEFLQQLRPGSVSEDTYNIFIVGSVESRKGVEYVVQSIPETVQRIPEARFCFFGHYAPDNADWANANSKLHPKVLYNAIPETYHSHLHFFNYIPHADLPKVLAGGDVFPILSLGDNFPGSVAEIALSAKPIVALEAGGVKEMLQDGTGCFQALSLGSDLAKASHRLAAALTELYSQKERGAALGEKLQRLVYEKYNPEKVVPLLMKSYWEAYCR